MNCDMCGEKITMGTATCVRCGEEQCVDQCIPGGNKTVCVACEEAEDEED